jgi:hypothetical protein
MTVKESPPLLILHEQNSKLALSEAHYLLLQYIHKYGSHKVQYAYLYVIAFCMHSISSVIDIYLYHAFEI